MQSNKLVVVIDDEPDITELVVLHFRNAGFNAKEFNDPQSFLRSLKKHMPDLIILDLMLPDTDGIEICKTLKKDEKYSAIPIIMLTAKADETDKILGLEIGADDYVTKPFSPKELVARAKAVLRRNEQHKSVNKSTKANLTINREKFEVLVEGKRIDVTTTEFKIIELLASKRGHVFSRDRILDILWGEDKIVLDRTIDVHIRNIREKLGKTGKLIKNIRGMGYKLEE